MPELGQVTARKTGLEALKAMESTVTEKVPTLPAELTDDKESFIIRIPRSILMQHVKESTTGKSLVVTARTDRGTEVTVYGEVDGKSVNRKFSLAPMNINLTLR